MSPTTSSAAVDVGPSDEEVDAELARKKFSEFIKQGWDVLEPGEPFDWNWHIELIADHLQAMYEDWRTVQLRKRKRAPKSMPWQQAAWEAARALADFEQRIQNLLINVPPGTAKSRIISVFFPAWVWLDWPSFRFLALSANPDVALRDSLYCRDLIESDWYQNTFRPQWTLDDKQNAKGNFRNTAGGVRVSKGITSKITGARADAIIVDDPHDAQEVKSDTMRKAVTSRWTSAIRNRVNSLQHSLRIGVMQRLHEEDWSGVVLKQGGWEHLMLPMEYEPERARVTAIGLRDPRTQPGELLFPARFPQKIVEAEKDSLRGDYYGQHQQRPAPADGAIFKKSWWRFWRFEHEDPVPELEDRTLVIPTSEHWIRFFEFIAQSWDCSFKKNATSDYVAGGSWGVKGANKFLLDIEWDRMDFVETKKRLEKQHDGLPKVSAVLVEDAANGVAVMNSLKQDNRIGSIIPVSPKDYGGDKVARARASTPQLEGGNVYIPLHARWKDEYMNEHALFPNGTNDDAVDQQSQFLNWLAASPVVASVPGVETPEERGSIYAQTRQ